MKTSHGELRLLELLDDPRAMLVEDTTRFREAQSARRAIQQARADRALELRDLLAYERLGQPEATRGGREIPFLDDACKDGHSLQIFHDRAARLFPRRKQYSPERNSKQTAARRTGRESRQGMGFRV